jgi:mono/diheme cytochrome c family protein
VGKTNGNGGISMIVGNAILGSAIGVCLGFASIASASAQDASQAFDGKWQYYALCAGCHGDSGEGLYPFGPALKGNPFVQNAPLPALAQVIQEGRNYANRTHLAYVGMPAYVYIRGGELEALVNYMKGEMQK